MRCRKPAHAGERARAFRASVRAAAKVYDRRQRRSCRGGTRTRGPGPARGGSHEIVQPHVEGGGETLERLHRAGLHAALDGGEVRARMAAAAASERAVMPRCVRQTRTGCSPSTMRRTSSAGAQVSSGSSRTRWMAATSAASSSAAARRRSYSFAGNHDVVLAGEGQGLRRGGHRYASARDSIAATRSSFSDSTRYSTRQSPARRRKPGPPFRAAAFGFGAAASPRGRRSLMQYSRSAILLSDGLEGRGRTPRCGPACLREEVTKDAASGRSQSRENV